MQAFFLTAGVGGQRFCILHAPRAGSPPGAALLYIHPFAEEMNKARRMAALQARALAEAGHAVLQIDLRGCGDSSDDFGDASWDDWLADVALGLDWLAAQYADRPLWLWGLRAGCLLASQTAQRRPDIDGLLFWQPVLAGKLQLQQFLRLRLATELAGGSQGLMKALRQALLIEGRPIEVAGYALAPALAQGLENAALAAPAAGQALRWLELSAQAELLPASQSWLQQYAAAPGCQALALPGPAFWGTAEIEDAPALIAATLQAMAP